MVLAIEVLRHGVNFVPQYNFGIKKLLGAGLFGVFQNPVNNTFRWFRKGVIQIFGHESQFF